MIRYTPEEDHLYATRAARYAALKGGARVAIVRCSAWPDNAFPGSWIVRDKMGGPALDVKLEREGDETEIVWCAMQRVKVLTFDP
jgi:hypothetical protein